MEKTSAKITEDITVAWLQAYGREGAMTPPNGPEVAEFYRQVFETVADCIAGERMRTRMRPRSERY